MSWMDLRLAPGGTHHLRSGAPAYRSRFTEVLKYRAPGLAPVRLDNQAWHILPDGQPAYCLRFRKTFGFYEDLASVEGEDGWHHIYPDGSAAYSQRYAWCGNFQGGRCSVRLRAGTYRHICPDGSSAYPGDWSYVGDFRDGVAVVQDARGLHTHIDAGGSQTHGRWWLDLGVFHKGFARARDAGGWHHVDSDGNPLYSQRYAAVEPFYNGQARVETFEECLEVINEQGESVQELRSGGLLPASTLAWIAKLPMDRPVAMLIRHAARDPLPMGDEAWSFPITARGRGQAYALGSHLGPRLQSLSSSPLTRCIQTAEALCLGAEANRSVAPDRMLGDPGAYVLDDQLAWQNWERLGHEEVMRHLVSSGDALPGMAHPKTAAFTLVEHMLVHVGSTAGVHAFVTHDSLVTATAAQALSKELGPDAWPDFLEAAFFWKQGDRIVAAYRGDSSSI